MILLLKPVAFHSTVMQLLHLCINQFTYALPTNIFFENPNFHATTLEIYSLPLALLRGFPWIAPTPS
jgi:hypothetical protein